ncbi:hypothetical protein MGSAQ_001151 [marine sediment metagenome]|uniref:Uncharacterized protein n=1 Tax=marine sediment metagenome TaxID=412755 RepID=A0A1B6NWK8_9ZZZZ
MLCRTDANSANKHNNSLMNLQAKLTQIQHATTSVAAVTIFVWPCALFTNTTV